MIDMVSFVFDIQVCIL